MTTTGVLLIAYGVYCADSGSLQSPKNGDSVHTKSRIRIYRNNKFLRYI